MSVQLPLALTLRAHSSFDNFSPGSNRELVARLRHSAVNDRDALLFVAGSVGVGKTHLLEASCRAADAAGRTAAYVPLALKAELAPTLLDGLETRDLICVDDIDRVAGDREWEQALFGLYERARAHACVWVATAAHKPAQIDFALRDLANRLQTGLVYSLHALADADKMAVVQARAVARGLSLGEEAAQYLLARYPRDLPALLALLERIDRESLAQQRRLTIPFLRSLLESPTTP